MELLKELTEAKAVSGYEENVRHIMRRELESSGCDSIFTDGMGSIFGEKVGVGDGPRIMLASHMDEVGFMVTEIHKTGYLYFTPLGGWWDQVLLSQRVTIMSTSRNFTGVIGSKPPHLLKPDERNRVYPMGEMYIDVGAKDAEQVKKWGIKVGDPIVPICPFEMMPDHDTILAKALDDRLGCYIVLEAFKQLKNEDHPNRLFAGATVQEEVGLRGAKTAPRAVEPDVAIAVDVGIAQDGPTSDGTKPRLGGGALITFLDATMIPNVGLRNLVIDTAEEHQIPYQVDTMMGGGTDAGQFHLFHRGVPSLVIGVPARYIHSHVSMVSKKDTEAAIKLLAETIKKLDDETVKSFTAFKE
ncbi:endoglucanase [Marininema mesophilum]|uniref:Endoglucanase n=1 Tax=Marininema mesophilum TaxID=1048340 RepID=A0A1H2R130_9BACL|nr:M42 family metallopeptidase [Marininema mesophilum]SDW13107.1 endoglucanase [Marininema mesophilum]